MATKIVVLVGFGAGGFWIETSHAMVYPTFVKMNFLWPECTRFEDNCMLRVTNRSKRAVWAWILINHVKILTMVVKTASTF
jgi:hypothetical protein